MAAKAGSSLDLTIAFDQLSGGQLADLILKKAKPGFQFGKQIAQYWPGPVSAVPKDTAFSLAISDSADWKTSTGITFSLKAVTASCKLEVMQNNDPVIQYVANTPPLGTTDAASATKANLPDQYTGAYLKLSLDFEIQSSVGGSGTLAGGIGISGKATGGAGASLVFCHRVDSSTVLQAAIRETFQKLVFPFEPSSANDMDPGDLAQVNFHATLDTSLELSYGIAKYNFTGPSTDAVLNGIADNTVKLGLPSVKIDIGATGKIGYSHSDDFTAIVQKLSKTDAFLYLMRAKKDDVNGKVGVQAQVKITGNTVVPDAKKIQKAVDSVTKNLAGAKVAAKATDLADKLNNSLTSWISDQAKNGVGLSAAWDNQTSTMMLFKYRVNLTDTNARDLSWKSLCLGDITSAVGAGGLLLLPGSGVNHDLSETTTLEFHFFNLLKAQDLTKYFKNSQVVITDTGDVKFLFDIGIESTQTVNAALSELRFHFVGSAQAKTAADVDLYVEATAKNHADAATRIAEIVGFLPSNPSTNTAHNDMQAFAVTGQGTLNLVCIVKRSAYQNLTCSEYIADKPPKSLQLDRQNWEVFRDAAVQLGMLTFVGPQDFARLINWDYWQRYNVTTVGGLVPDRKSFGSQSNPTFWPVEYRGNSQNLDAFYTDSSRLMDLCDSLHALAGLVGTVKIPDDWNTLLNFVSGMVRQDIGINYGPAAAAAVLSLCHAKTYTYKKESATNSLTCTLTLESSS